MFNGPAHTTRGGGAVDPMMALLALTALLGVAVERRRRSSV
jgi:MYXO-CTERM domain-containing protein